MDVGPRLARGRQRVRSAVFARLADLETNSAEHDVTGGIVAKLDAAAAIAAAGTPVIIAQASAGLKVAGMDFSQAQARAQVHAHHALVPVTHS